MYQNGNEFLLFSNGVLVQQFDNAQEYAAFMATLTASNSAYTAQQAQEQTALEATRLDQQTSYTRSRSYWAPVVGTALVGGLLWGDIYLHNRYRPHRPYYAAPVPAPRPVPHHRPGHLKPLKPSGPPAGTPMMRDVNGKFMHR